MSSTGFDARTVQKQFGNSPVMAYLLQCFDQWVDPAKFQADFLASVWDISTAKSFGLDIWGRILGVSRYLQIAQTPGDDFGFSTNGESSGGQAWKPWSQAPFYGGAAAGTVAYALQDTYYRQLLMLKAATNIAKCDPLTINRLMMSMFGDRGKCYCGFDPNITMNIGYHFEFVPTAVEQAIIESGIFPCPAGMVPHFIYATVGYAPFGFAGANVGANPNAVTGWNQGPFYSSLYYASLRNPSGGPFILDSSKLG